MALVFRWLVRATLGVILLGLAGLFFVYWIAGRSLPDYEKTLAVEGLTAPIEIVRTTHNVPHIFGQADRDVFFGLGYAHAQDRLWQMTLMRRTLQGRLSELFGTRTLPTDELLRRLDLYGHAQRSVAAQDPQTLAVLEAYAAGVNARVQEVNTRALGRGAPEFFLFEPQIEPWQPADSIGIVNLMALQLAGEVSQEVLIGRARLLLPPERVVDLHPVSPGDGIAALPDLAALWPGLREKAFASADVTDPFLWPVPSRGHASASNVWAVTPERSATRGTLLAHDPHLELAAPSIWYLARLELSTGGVIGGTIPGMPVVLAGRSDLLSWGVTYSDMDAMDLFIEQLDAEDPSRYRTPQGWASFETRRSVINVKGEDPITINLRWSQNGPILAPDQFDVGLITPPGHVAALSWTALSNENVSLRTALELMRAKTVEAGLAAGEHHVAPAQNLMVADGTQIAMQVIGHQVRRDVDHQTRGRLPSPGWELRNRWQGVMPYASNPRFVEPAGGVLMNTNNKLLDAPFPNHLSYSWSDTQRVNRLARLMQARQLHSRDSFIEAQLDTVSFSARALLPLIGRELWFTGSLAEAGTPARRQQDALQLLASWNGEMSEHLPEPLIYATWVRMLQQRLIQDEIGPLGEEYLLVEPLFLERVYRDIDGAAVWCDVVQTSRDETCAEMAALALEDALAWLSETYGGSVQALRWGDAHEAQHDHPVLKDVPFFGLFANIRQSTSGGDNTLMRGKTSGTDPDPFLNVHASGYRGVYDMAAPDNSVFVVATGQSGHPLSRHYDDLSELWRRGEYIPMSLDPLLARAGAVGVTTLTPAE